MVTGLTAIGVAWLVSYRVTPNAGLQAQARPAGGEPAGAPSPGTAPTPPPSSAGVGSPPPASGTSTFTGQDMRNRFGDVKVQVVVSNGRITDVKALALPNDRAQSAYISQVAGPMLRSEALQAQSANIDIISGATYTSDSYAQSLETALRQAHLG